MSSGSRAQNVENYGEELDQRTFDAAPPNAHDDLDSKYAFALDTLRHCGLLTQPPIVQTPINFYCNRDQRSLANRAAAAAKHEREADKPENQKTVTDPLEPARAHGNEPSRGAKIDAQLQAEDEEMLRKKND